MTSQAKTESLDPITVEVVRYKLDGIANEMQSTLLRSSFSPIVKEGLDASASLFTADGTTLSQSCSIPIHLATLIPAVAKVLETYPARRDARRRHLHPQRPLHAAARICPTSPSSRRSFIATRSSR